VETLGVRVRARRVWHVACAAQHASLPLCTLSGRTAQQSESQEKARPSPRSMRQRGLSRAARSRIGRTVFEGGRVVGGWVRDFGHAGVTPAPGGARWVGCSGRCGLWGRVGQVDAPLPRVRVGRWTAGRPPSGTTAAYRGRLSWRPMSACTGQLHAGVTAHATPAITCGHRRTSAARAARCLECESSERPNLSCGSSPPPLTEGNSDGGVVVGAS
jgi:hypothetical protein